MELRDAGGLADLVSLTGVDSEHAAYFAAKREWDDLRSRELASQPPAASPTPLPGNTVTVGDAAFHVHGITHANTRAERRFLRRHVADVLADGDAVYCEQGVRSMYFADFEPVCEIDDYRWAMAECEELEDGPRVADVLAPGFDSLSEDVDSLTDRIRNGVFSLIESASTVDDGPFRRALGDVASSLLTSKEEMATGEDFESFRKRRIAATHPERLIDLQHYYERRFLPQPIEREWLRRHDPQLELVTHARNQRMADYALYHNDIAESVHLVVGAAHQPGVTYYLKQHRDGIRDLAGFDPIP
jgi:hypothetical protein